MATQSRTKRILGLVLAGIVAFAAAKLADGTLSALWSPSVTKADLEKEIDKFGAFKLIKQHLPDDYAHAVTELHAVATSNGRGAIEGRALEVGAELRKKHADRIFAARSQTLRSNTDSLIVLFRMVQKEHGNQACAEFAQKGGEALLPYKDQPKYLEAIDKQGQLLWEAMLVQDAGAKPRAAATDADWSLVGQAAIDKGMTPAEIDLVAEEKYQDPAYCEAFIKFMEGASAIQGEAGDRVRATLLVEMSKA